MTTNRGDKINILGFSLSVVGALLAFFYATAGGLVALLGGALMFWGANLSGGNVWKSLKKIQGDAENATLVAEDEWTPEVRLNLLEKIPAAAKTVTITYKMHCPDIRVPLKMRVRCESIGFISAPVSGPQGVFNLTVGDGTILVSVSNKKIIWEVGTSGYSF